MDANKEVGSSHPRFNPEATNGESSEGKEAQKDKDALKREREKEATKKERLKKLRAKQEAKKQHEENNK